jgi:hypothetical protein
MKKKTETKPKAAPAAGAKTADKKPAGGAAKKGGKK